MRVGFIGSTDDIFTRIFADEMVSRGISVSVLSEVQPSWEVEWVPLRPKKPVIPGLGLGKFALARSIKQAVADGRVDVLHVQQMGMLSGVCALSGVHPLVMTPWGSDVLRIKEWGPTVQIATRAGMTQADAVTCCAPHIRDAAVRLGARAERCIDINWGVDETVYYPEQRSRERIRRDWSVDAADVVYLSTRRLDPLYRIDALLEAFARVLESSPNSILVIASDGSSSEDLRALAVHLGIAARVRFLGRVPDSGWPGMADVYRGADVYCSVPWSDGAPLSVLEAMATALPVVASDLPSMRDWIAATGAGELWDGSSTDGLAAEMLAVAKDARAMGSASLNYAVSSQRRSVEMDRLQSMYEDLVRRAGNRRA